MRTTGTYSAPNMSHTKLNMYASWLRLKLKRYHLCNSVMLRVWRKLCSCPVQLQLDGLVSYLTSYQVKASSQGVPTGYLDPRLKEPKLLLLVCIPQGMKIFAPSLWHDMQCMGRSEGRIIEGNRAEACFCCCIYMSRGIEEGIFLNNLGFGICQLQTYNQLQTQGHVMQGVAGLDMKGLVVQLLYLLIDKV